jgi:hypothetical protein
MAVENRLVTDLIYGLDHPRTKIKGKNLYIFEKNTKIKPVPKRCIF